MAPTVDHSGPGFGPDDPVVMGAAGFHVPGGGFHVDPWGGVDRAIITHAHADHARGGSRHYLCTPETAAVMRVRIGPNLSIDELPYGETRTIGDVRVSLHPAGHVLGSAQVRIETGRGVWVISGDYGVHPNPTCAAFEPVACDTFISECTFGLPIYRWSEPHVTFDAINAWWAANAERGRTSVLLAYALGKAQRLLDGVDHSIGPVLVHGAMRRVNAVYASFGQTRVDVPHAAAGSIAAAGGRGLVVAPPSAAGSPWMRRFEPCSLGLASGWMRIRGPRRRRAADRGFVLSDHADWDGLLSAIRATGCERVGLTHGSVEPMARYLAEEGWATAIYNTRFVAAPDRDADAEADVETNTDVDAGADANADAVPNADADADANANADADADADANANANADADADANANADADANANADANADAGANANADASANTDANADAATRIDAGARASRDTNGPPAEAEAPAPSAAPA